MVVMMMMVMMVMVHLHCWSGRSARCRLCGRGGFLRNGVSGQADGESGGGDKIFDHEGFLLSTRPLGSSKKHLRVPRLN
jgi:hypothetical protein